MEFLKLKVRLYRSPTSQNSFPYYVQLNQIVVIRSTAHLLSGVSPFPSSSPGKSSGGIIRFVLDYPDTWSYCRPSTTLYQLVS